MRDSTRWLPRARNKPLDEGAAPAAMPAQRQMPGAAGSTNNNNRCRNRPPEWCPQHATGTRKRCGRGAASRRPCAWSPVDQKHAAARVLGGVFVMTAR